MSSTEDRPANGAGKEEKRVGAPEDSEQVSGNMRYSHSSKTKEEIKKKLAKLYSEPPFAFRQVLDFDKGYDFFSESEVNMIKYSSKWFAPDKYDRHTLHERFRHVHEDEEHVIAPKINWDEGVDRNPEKSDSLWRLERLGYTGNQLTRDLEKLGRTPYHLGIEGEKFRVVAATLQKCNSPFVRRTFQFTSNGIVETPESRNDSDQVKLFPIINPAKKGVTQKLVTIRRFRVIKKDNFTGEKSVLPHKVKVANREKPRFLTVRIRSKERQNYGEAQPKKDLEVPEVVRLTSSTEEEDCDFSERTQSPPAQAEETDDGEEFVTKPTAENSAFISEQKNEAETVVEDKKAEEVNSNDTDEASSVEDFGKRFSAYPAIFTDFRTQQQQGRQTSKKFLSTKHLREKPHHQRYTRSGGTVEDRIKTATSKFGRTRRVLNIAGLRSKYKML